MDMSRTRSPLAMSDSSTGGFVRLRCLSASLTSLNGFLLCGSKSVGPVALNAPGPSDLPINVYVDATVEPFCNCLPLAMAEESVQALDDHNTFRWLNWLVRGNWVFDNMLKSRESNRARKVGLEIVHKPGIVHHVKCERSTLAVRHVRQSVEDSRAGSGPQPGPGTGQARCAASASHRGSRNEQQVYRTPH